MFLIAVVGFAVAFHGMFKYAVSDDGSRTFESFEQTILVLFDASLGQHDFTMFKNEPYHYLGEILFILYMMMTMIVLLNLVIATFSVSVFMEKTTHGLPYTNIYASISPHTKG